MKHCTLPTLLAVKTTILPTVPSSRAGQKRQNSETGKLCIVIFLLLFLLLLSFVFFPISFATRAGHQGELGSLEQEGIRTF